MVHGAVGLEGEFELAGPELCLNRSHRHAELLAGTAQFIRHRLQRVVAAFGQILIAVREKAGFRRHGRHSAVFMREALLVDIEDIELDLEPADKVQPPLPEAADGVAQYTARAERK